MCREGDFDLLVCQSINLYAMSVFKLPKGSMIQLIAKLKKNCGEAISIGALIGSSLEKKCAC